MKPTAATPARPIVLALAVHPQRAAATRLRVCQYAPGLEKAGLDFRLWTLLTDVDEARWLNAAVVWRLALVARRCIRRVPTLVRLVRRASVVVVQREIVPVGPAVIEALIKRRRPLIWDIDDAVWEHHTSISWAPRWLRSTRNKYDRLCGMADEVWAGSEVLASWCRDRNINVVVVPTVVDVPAHLPSGERDRRLVWIGSPTTGPFLEQVLPSLADLDPPIALRIVGARPVLPANLTVDVSDWSPAEEDSALQGARVGLYPIDRQHPLADGKCGLKAILYMAHGVPPVVTPTSTNAAIVRAGIEGLHAHDPHEWTAAVGRLLDDNALWQRLRVAGHRRAAEEYSLEVWSPRVAARLLALAADGVRP